MMEFQKFKRKRKKPRFNKMFNKPILYSSAIKLMKLVYTPSEVVFLKNTSNKLFVSLNSLTSRKRDQLISLSIENRMFLCFLLIYSRKNRACSGLLYKKNTIPISLVKNWFEIFPSTFQPITFVITKRNINQFWA